MQKMVHEGSARAETVPENLWRLRLSIVIAMLTAFGIELGSRHLHTTDAWGEVYPRLLSLLALMLLCSAALYLIFLLERRALLKGMVSISTLLLFLSQSVNTARHVPSLQDRFALLNEWGSAIEGPLLLAGIVLLLTTFYFALLETVMVKAILRRERRELVREIGERERAQSELQMSRDELRSLSSHVENVRDDERARVSRELHDDLGQTLTSLKIDLATLKQHVNKQQSPDPVVLESIASMSEQVDATVQATRRIMTELHPAMLEELGLKQALDWLVSEFGKRTAIACRTEIQTNGTAFGPERSRAIFRIVQECLTNIARHAQATEVDVCLSVTPGTIQVEVADNGVGIVAPAPGLTRKSFGIAGMRERVNQFGGKLHVETTPGKGTRIRVSIPGGEG